MSLSEWSNLLDFFLDQSSITRQLCHICDAPLTWDELTRGFCVNGHTIELQPLKKHSVVANFVQSGSDESGDSIWRFEFITFDDFSLAGENKFSTLDFRDVQILCVLPNDKNCVLINVVDTLDDLPVKFCEKAPRFSIESIYLFSILFSASYLVTIFFRKTAQKSSDIAIQICKIKSDGLIIMPDVKLSSSEFSAEEKLNRLGAILKNINKKHRPVTAAFDLGFAYKNYTSLPFFRLLTDFKSVGVGYDSQVFKSKTKDFVLKVGNLNVEKEYLIYQRLAPYNFDFILPILGFGRLKYASSIDISDYMECAFLAIKYIKTVKFTDRQMANINQAYRINLAKIFKTGIVDIDRHRGNFLTTLVNGSPHIYLIDWGRAVDMLDPDVSLVVKKHFARRLLELYPWVRGLRLNFLKDYVDEESPSPETKRRKQ